MFSSEDRLKRRQGKYGTSRFDHLQKLVTEFQETSSEEAKKQVLANLANFAYDPINYDHLHKLNVLDLFLDSLTESDPKLIEFALGGLCNCCPDPACAKFIVQNEGIPLIIACLSSTNLETVLSAITILFYLLGPETKAIIATQPVLECIDQYAQAKLVRLSNVAKLFLQEVSKYHSK